MGIMENQMENDIETVIILGIIGVVYWSYIRIMEKKMEATIMGLYRVYKGFGLRN